MLICDRLELLYTVLLNTGSPTWNDLSLCYISLPPFVDKPTFLWRLSLFFLQSSSYILASSLFSNFVKVVLVVGKEISIGIIASVQYTIVKGVSPVTVRFVVRYGQRTFGSSSTHLLFGSSSFFLMHHDFIGGFGLTILLRVDP